MKRNRNWISNHVHTDSPFISFPFKESWHPGSSCTFYEMGRKKLDMKAPRTPQEKWKFYEKRKVGAIKKMMQLAVLADIPCGLFFFEKNETDPRTLKKISYHFGPKIDGDQHFVLKQPTVYIKDQEHFERTFDFPLVTVLGNNHPPQASSIARYFHPQESIKTPNSNITTPREDVEEISDHPSSSEEEEEEEESENAANVENVVDGDVEILEEGAVGNLFGDGDFLFGENVPLDELFKSIQ